MEAMRDLNEDGMALALVPRGHREFRDRVDRRGQRKRVGLGVWVKWVWGWVGWRLRWV
jgi:hypothetical protein